jgi:hypothetical protein
MKTYLNYILRSCLFLIVLPIVVLSCQEASVEGRYITVSNPTDMDRKGETVEVDLSKAGIDLGSNNTEDLKVKDADSGAILLSQLLDQDGDGNFDHLIFQVDISPNQTRRFLLTADEGGERPSQTGKSTYSRFVPERTDDYAWENDRVAFRTYGPDAQRRAENRLPEGTLSSGVDAWLKKVDYPIIDKWYTQHLESDSSYHVDHGEGYDPYHVGSSRGIGGVGVWIDDSLHISKNFISHKTLVNGPIRSVFELTYAPRVVNGIRFTETKRISLDLGSHLYKSEVILEADQNLPNLTVGITLHDKEGEVKTSQDEGWFRYWEPMDGSQLGLGIVVDPNVVQSYKDHRVDYRDGSQLLVMTDLNDGKTVYYAGFAWDQSGHFRDALSWDNYLMEFSRRLQQPLKVSYE